MERVDPGFKPCNDTKCTKIHMSNFHHYGECECMGCMSEIARLKRAKRA